MTSFKLSIDQNMLRFQKTSKIEKFSVTLPTSNFQKLIQIILILSQVDLK